MKLLIPGLFLLLLSCSGPKDDELYGHADSNSKTTEFLETMADTIEIWDSLAGQPFLFSDWEVSLDSILVRLPSSTSLERSVRPSDYHKTEDSVTKITIRHSTIEHVKTALLGYVSFASIVDRDIQLCRDIRIGDDYEDVVKKLVGLPVSNIRFRKIYLKDGEATSTLIMLFSDGRLSEVTFCPYTG